MPRNRANEPVNPLLDVDPQVEQEAFNEYAGQAPDRIKQAIEQIENQMLTAFNEGGNGETLDVTKMNSLGETLSPAERCTKVIQLHSQLSGAQSALNNILGMAETRDAIRDANRGGGPSYTEQAFGQQGHDAPDPANSGQIIQFPGGGVMQPRSLSQQFRNAEARHHTRLGRGASSNTFSLEFDLLGQDGRDIHNTLFKRTDGWDPFVERMPGYVPHAQRPIQVTDTLPVVTTMQQAVKYMEETTFTNAAAEVAEGNKYAESTLELTERTVPIEKIATFIPVTEEQLEDESQVNAYLDNRLMFMLRQKLDAQILLGNGTAPNLQGLLGLTGVTDRAWTTNTAKTLRTDVMNDVRKAKIDVMFTGRAMASHAILNYLVWDEIVGSTHSNGYYLGSPADAFQERIWGLPVVQTDILSSDVGDTDAGALVADMTNFTNLYMRRAFIVEAGLQNDDFVKGKVTLRATVRCAAVCYRPAALVKLTGPSP